MLCIFLGVSNRTSPTPIKFENSWFGQLSLGSYLFIDHILPEIIALLCTAFVLLSGKYITKGKYGSKYAGVITRGVNNKWKEEMNNPKAINLFDKSKPIEERIVLWKEHCTRIRDELDPDRRLI